MVSSGDKKVFSCLVFLFGVVVEMFNDGNECKLYHNYVGAFPLEKSYNRANTKNSLELEKNHALLGFLLFILSVLL